jgi:hypothetical protein
MYIYCNLSLLQDALGQQVILKGLYCLLTNSTAHLCVRKWKIDIFRTRAVVSRCKALYNIYSKDRGVHYRSLG